MNDGPPSKVRRAALLLGTWGLIETIIFIWAIRHDEGFAGGGPIYFWMAFKLYKRDPKAYSWILRVTKIIAALLIGGVAGYAVQVLHFMSVRRPVALAAEFPCSAYVLDAIYLLAAPLACLAILFLLGHPDARQEMKLENTEGTAGACFLPSNQLATIFAGGLAAVALLGGPHLVKNPYTSIIHAALTSQKLAAEIGTPQRMTLVDFSENNWTFITTWNVLGKDRSGKYEIRVDANQRTTIEPSRLAVALNQ